MSERVRAKSKALASAHAIVSGLHKLGLIDKETMREFDEACLSPIKNSQSADKSGEVTQ